ncbi:unnamed protein product [Nesidiocoris tenuis]|uniref:Uncharacterized protein n=1 Tax=Nesidiocoris tenuis TaxID=355587 RepID=A0A6H5GX89_9HEMI|nr:unnamed protein product [Nesidiocoris tenuis]
MNCLRHASLYIDKPDISSSTAYNAYRSGASLHNRTSGPSVNRPTDNRVRHALQATQQSTTKDTVPCPRSSPPSRRRECTNALQEHNDRIFKTTPKFPRPHQSEPRLTHQLSGFLNGLSGLEESRIVCIRWAIVSTVHDLNSDLIVFWIKSSVSKSTAAVASSSTKTLVFLKRARAKQISCLCPKLEVI